MTEDEMKKAAENLPQEQVKELNAQTRERVSELLANFRKRMRALNN